MGLFDLINHLLNFAAPAVWLALSVTLAAHFFMKKVPAEPTLLAQAAINFVVCLAVLGLGLWFFGRDAKMATYVAMVLLSATSQWFLKRGWR
jgi:hypothetical protein